MSFSISNRETAVSIEVGGLGEEWVWRERAEFGLRHIRGCLILSSPKPWMKCLNNIRETSCSLYVCAKLSLRATPSPAPPEQNPS